MFRGSRHPRTLNVRDWQKFIRERRAGTLRPLSLAEKPVRSVSDRQLRYDLKIPDGGSQLRHGSA